MGGLVEVEMMEFGLVSGEYGVVDVYENRELGRSMQSGKASNGRDESRMKGKRKQDGGQRVDLISSPEVNAQHR